MGEVIDVNEEFADCLFSVEDLYALEKAFKNGFPGKYAFEIRAWYGNHCRIATSVEELLQDEARPSSVTQLLMRIDDAPKDPDKYFNRADLYLRVFSHFKVFANDQTWGNSALRSLEDAVRKRRPWYAKLITFWIPTVSLGGLALCGFQLEQFFEKVYQPQSALDLLQPPSYGPPIAAALAAVAFLLMVIDSFRRRWFFPEQCIALRREAATERQGVIGLFVAIAGAVLAIVAIAIAR